MTEQVMYLPLPAAKRRLETRRVRVGRAVYVVDDPRLMASWAFDPDAEEGTGGGPRTNYGRDDDKSHSHLLRAPQNRREAHPIHDVNTTPGMGFAGWGGAGGTGAVGVGGELAVDPDTAAKSATRAAAHANLTRSKVGFGGGIFTLQKLFGGCQGMSAAGREGGAMGKKGGGGDGTFDDDEDRRG